MTHTIRRRPGHRLSVVVLTLTTVALAIAPQAAEAASRGTVTTYTRPQMTPLYPGTEIPFVTSVTSGPDGNVWFVRLFPDHGRYLSELGRISPSGVFQRPYTTGNDLVRWITRGPDGNVWFTEQFGGEAGGGSVGRVTASGKVTRFPVCGGAPGCGLGEIVAGPGGNLWFTGYNPSIIGRITPAGVVTKFPVSECGPTHITTGSDGNLWFTFNGCEHQLGRITAQGVETEFAHPSASECDLHYLTAGRDGLLWVTSHFCGSVRAFRPGSPPQEVTDLCCYGAFSATEQITPGPDGVYFSLPADTSGVGRATTSGVTLFDLSPANYVQGLTQGPDRNIWFAYNVPDPGLGRLTTGA
jgi:streptogramin lyase